MRDFITNLEAKALIAGGKLLAPLKNRKAMDEGANSGLRGLAGLLTTIIVVSLIVIVTVIVTGNGQKAVDKLRGFMTNMWSAFDGLE